MDNELANKIQVKLSEYFLNLNTLFYDFLKFLRKLIIFSQCIRNYIERQNRIDRAIISNTSFPSDIKGKLKFHLIQYINSRLVNFEKIFKDMNDMSQKLLKQQKELDELTLSVDFNSETCALLTGSSTQPRLIQLLEYSHDGIIFATQICAQVASVLDCLKTPNSSISSDWLTHSLTVDSSTYTKINKIILTTEYCYTKQS